MNASAGRWNRWVVLGGALLCVFGLVAGHRCRGFSLSVTAPGAGSPQTQGKPIAKAFKGQAVGRVTDSVQKAVAGAEVALARWQRGRPLVVIARVRSDARGRFVVPIREPGVYHVLVSHPGRARWHRKIVVTSPGELALGPVRLRPGHAIRGRVVTAAGKLIPGAQLSAASTLALPGRPLEPPHGARADADGRFRVAGLGAGAHRLTVAARGFGTSVLKRVIAPSVGVRVVLRPLRVIAGRVVHRDLATPGATVELAGSGIWPPIRVTTDARGRFRFVGVRVGIYELRARKGKLISAPAPAVDLLGDDAPSQVDLELLEGATLVGKVLDAETREPLKGVRVIAARELLAVNPMIAQTTRDGSFVLEPVLPGEYRLTLERTGYLPRRGVEVSVIEGKNPPLELTLRRGGVLAGVVLDDTGREVFGARIEIVGRARGSYIADRSAHTVALQDTLWDHALRALSGAREPTDASAIPPGSLGVLPGPVPLAPAVDSPGDLTTDTGIGPLSGRAASFVTDKKGRFRVVGVPPGNLSLVVRHPDFARAKAGPFRLKRGEERKGIVVRMRPGTALEGVVLNPIGQPILGVQVAVADPVDPYHFAVRITDGKGRFRVPNLKGSVRLSLTAPGHVPLVHQLRVASKPNPQRISLTLQPADCRVGGRLVDSHRLPVKGARIALLSITPDAPSQGSALSDQDGRFVAKGLGKLSYRVTVQHESFPQHHFEVRCPAKPRLWKLSYGGGIAFEVRDKKTRASLRSFTYVLRRAGGPVIREDGFAGKAQHMPIPAGKYELIVRAPRYAQKKRTIYIPASKTPKQVTRRRVVVWMELGGAVEGHVRDDRGLAVEGALVKVAELEGRTDKQGRFRIEDVPPGTHELVATHPDRGTGKLADVVVKPGLPTVSLVIDLAPGSEDAKDVRAGLRVTLRVGADVEIGSVEAGSLAEKAGLARGDEILSIDGRDLDGLGLSDIEALLQGPSGTRVVLEIDRNGRTSKLSVKREILSDD